MSKPHSPRTGRNALSLKIGVWFEAQASGWGIVAIPVTLLLLAGLAIVRAWLLA